MGGAAPSCPLPPSRAPPWAPAAVLGGSRQQGTSLYQCPARAVFAAQHSPVTPLRLQGCVLGFSSAPSPLLSPPCETKAERAASAVRRVSYDPISLVYELMIQVSAMGSSGAAGLVLTSSCRMAAGGSSTREAKASAGGAEQGDLPGVWFLRFIPDLGWLPPLTLSLVVYVSLQLGMGLGGCSTEEISLWAVACGVCDTNCQGQHAVHPGTCNMCIVLRVGVCLSCLPSFINPR